MTLLEVRNIRKDYNGVTVVNIPQLFIAEGETVGLVGNNGAGKTTFFRMILDLVRPTAGEVLLKGKNVAGNGDWKSYTGSYLDERFLIDFLTPDEYFIFVARLHNISKGEMYERLKPFEEMFNDEILGKNKYIRDLSVQRNQRYS